MNTLAVEPPGRMTMTQLQRPSSTVRHALPSSKYEIYVGIIGVGDPNSPEDKETEMHCFCCMIVADGEEVVIKFRHPISIACTLPDLAKRAADNFAKSIEGKGYAIYEIKNGVIRDDDNVETRRDEYRLPDDCLNLFRQHLRKCVISGVEARV